MTRILLIVVLLAATLPSLAVEMRHSRDMLVIPKGQVIADDLVVSGKSLQMEGRIDGDLLVAASSARIDGPIMGDLIVAGGTVVINQPVAGSVYVVGGTVDIMTSVGRNMLVAGGTVNINPGTTIMRDLALTGGEVTVAGAVGRNLCGKAGRLTLTSTAVIHGDLLVMTNRPNIMTGAMIGGRKVITAARPGHRMHRGIIGWVGGHIYLGLALFIVGVIFLALCPRLSTETVGVLRAHPWSSLLTGFILLVVTPVAMLIACLLILGIPLALIALGCYLTMLFLSPIFVAMLIGQRLLRRPLDATSYLGLFIGMLLLTLVRLIPLLGGLLFFLLMLSGLGALFLSLRDRRMRAAA